jgi:hypothetical protein
VVSPFTEEKVIIQVKFGYRFNHKNSGSSLRGYRLTLHNIVACGNPDKAGLIFTPAFHADVLTVRRRDHLKWRVDIFFCLTPEAYLWLTGYYPAKGPSGMWRTSPYPIEFMSL